MQDIQCVQPSSVVYDAPGVCCEQYIAGTPLQVLVNISVPEFQAGEWCMGDVSADISDKSNCGSITVYHWFIEVSLATTKSDMLQLLSNPSNSARIILINTPCICSVLWCLDDVFWTLEKYLSDTKHVQFVIASFLNSTCSTLHGSRNHMAMAILVALVCKAGPKDFMASLLGVQVTGHPHVTREVSEGATIADLVIRLLHMGNTSNCLKPHMCLQYELLLHLFSDGMAQTHGLVLVVLSVKNWMLRSCASRRVGGYAITREWAVRCLYGAILVEMVTRKKGECLQQYSSADRTTCFGALTCSWTRAYFSARQWDPGIVHFILGTFLFSKLKLIAVYCVLELKYDIKLGYWGHVTVNLGTSLFWFAYWFSYKIQPAENSMKLHLDNIARALQELYSSPSRQPDFAIRVASSSGHRWTSSQELQMFIARHAYEIYQQPQGGIRTAVMLLHNLQSTPQL